MTDTNGWVYLRARYYHPTLGTFPTLDPLEGAPERPLSLHGYSWVEGNVVNATDPTGEQCEGSPNPQKLFAACGGGGGGGLGMLLITALTVAASYMVYRNAVCLADEALDLGLGLASELQLNISPLSEQVIRNLSSEPDDILSPVVEYRLTGFEQKVGTLAEHLAKLLEHDVAGYPPSDPNPYGRPNRGWCLTIKNKINEIRGGRYSKGQLSVDLEKAGFAGNKWDEITSAIAEVIEKGLCDDHWGDFDGGAPLTAA